MAVEINLPFMLYPASGLLLEVLFQFLDFFFCHKPRIHPAVTRTPFTYCCKEGNHWHSRAERQAVKPRGHAQQCSYLPRIATVFCQRSPRLDSVVSWPICSIL